MESGSWHPWQACYGESEHVAAILARSGLIAGDAVAVQLPNSTRLIAVHLAATRLGLSLFPIHQAYGPLETTSLMTRAGAVGFISDAEYRGRSRQPYLDRIRAQCPSLRTIWLPATDGLLQEWWAADALAHRAARQRLECVSVCDPSLLLASSGTTSTEPKVCVHRYAGLLENVAAVAKDVGFDHQTHSWLPDP